MADLQEYKCPACGGAIEFDSSIQKMKCPYCDTEYDVETLKKYDDILKNEEPDDMKWDSTAGDEWQEGEKDDLAVYGCKSCGGEIVVDKTTGATSCPYCGNPVVIMGQFTGNLKPNYIIPFKLDKKAAIERYNNHLKGKRLLPKIFKDKNHIDEIKGVYVPFWLFDADADGDVRYKATKINLYSDSKYNYTRTSHYSVVRKGEAKFEKVPVDGSSKISDEMMESIEPFNFEDATDFQTAYLAGYLADKYDVNEEDSVDRANDRIKKSIENEFKSSIKGYQSVVPENTNIQLKNGESKYVLYPVWLLNTTWDGNKYSFAMNGQTGKFIGDLPVDKAAYWKYFFIIMFVTAVIIYLVANLIF